MTRVEYRGPLLGAALTIALVAYGFAASDPPGARPIGSSAWASLNERATRAALTEAAPPPYATDIAGAALHWLGRLDDVPIAEVVHFADVTASQTDHFTGLVVMSVAAFESRFHEDVLSGRTRGDNGAACGALQIHVEIQHRPGDPRTCAEACASTDVYVAMGLRWWRDTKTAWGNWAFHEARARAWMRR